ncbi:MAG: ABC transporter ATP-binding protein [Clostridiales bacterium]|nr:ABC transporter ATP-binding protein [Clostridiales bacterium]
MRKLLKYLSNYKKETVIAPLFKMLEASFELLIPIVMANIIDIGIRDGDETYIWKMCGLMVGLGVLGLACSLTAQYFAAKAALGFGTELRRDMYRHINSLSYQELDRIGTSTLVTRMTSDINQVQTGVNMVLRLFLRSPFIVVGAVIMAFTISVKLTVIFLAAVPLIGLAIYLIIRLTIPVYKKVQSILDRIVGITRENYVGARVVRAFSRQEDEKKDFRQESELLKTTQLYAGKISALMNPITFVLVNLAILALLWFGGWQVQKGAITQGQVVALVNYMNQILLALVALANLIIAFTRATACAIRVNEVFALLPSMKEGEKKKPEKTGQVPKVVFDHVSFTYGGAREESLSDISFQAMPGEVIGIIGGTGSGKSTLVNLIPRFYDPQQGNVLVDGMNVKEYRFRPLREKIGLVPQKAVLFMGTIRENMQWRKSDAEDKEIWRALEIAQGREVVEKKPKKLDEKVESGGRNFSGGQRQRLTIARALVGSPEILILDDSASALDFATDAALRRAIKHEITGTTVFIVSQRAAAVKSADRILVLDDGKLAGWGSHEELLKDCPVYREICLSQFSKEEVAG